MNEMVGPTVEVDVLLNCGGVSLSGAAAVTAVSPVYRTEDTFHEEAKEGKVHIDIDRVE